MTLIRCKWCQETPTIVARRKKLTTTWRYECRSARPDDYEDDCDLGTRCHDPNPIGEWRATLEEAEADWIARPEAVWPDQEPELWIRVDCGMCDRRSEEFGPHSQKEMDKRLLEHYGWQIEKDHGYICGACANPPKPLSVEEGRKVYEDMMAKLTTRISEEFNRESGLWLPKGAK